MMQTKEHVGRRQIENTEKEDTAGGVFDAGNKGKSI